MASDVMSLFGLDPNVIQQQRVQGGIDQASRMNADYAIGAAGGGMLGAGINSAFGLQTPDMQQAQSVQDSMQGQDLSSSAGLRQAASKLMASGNYAQAMALHTRASALDKEANKSPDVEGIKMYTLSDGTDVQGAIVNGVPSYREGNKWVPLPDDAKISSTDKYGRSATTVQLTEVLTRMRDNEFTDGLSGSEKDKAKYWIATRAKALEADGTDWQLALDQAMQEAETRVDKEGGWFGTDVMADFLFDSTNEEATPTPTATKPDWRIHTARDGTKYRYDYNGIDKTVTEL